MNRKNFKNSISQFQSKESKSKGPFSWVMTRSLSKYNGMRSVSAQKKRNNNDDNNNDNNNNSNNNNYNNRNSNLNDHYNTYIQLIREIGMIGVRRPHSWSPVCLIMSNN